MNSNAKVLLSSPGMYQVEALRGELAKREKDLEVLRSVLEDSRRQLSDFECNAILR